MVMFKSLMSENEMEKALLEGGFPVETGVERLIDTCKVVESAISLGYEPSMTPEQTLVFENKQGYLDLSSMFNSVYEKLAEKEKSCVDYLLSTSKLLNHVCICRECGKKYFSIPENVDYRNHFAVISEDYSIDVNVAHDTVCEFGDCEKESDYTVNFICKDQE